MSGHLRTKIGQKKGQLWRYLDGGEETHPLLDVTISLQQNADDLKSKRGRLLRESEKIKAALAALDDCHAKWSLHISGLEDGAAEQQLLDEAADGESGFFPLVVESEERLAELSAALMEIDNEHQSLSLQLAMEQRVQLAMEQRDAAAGHSTPDRHRRDSLVDQARGQVSRDGFYVPHVQHNRAPKKPHLVLPQLKIDPFDGDVLKWRGFWEAFKAIHEYPEEELAPNMKMRHLLFLLTSNVKETIEGIIISDDNYSVAVKLLEEEYGDEKKINKALYKKIRDLPMLKSGRRLDVKYFIQNVEKWLRQLEAAGEELEHLNIVEQIRSKIPTFVHMKLAEQSSDDDDLEWTLAKLRKALKKYLRIQESASELFDELPSQMVPPRQRVAKFPESPAPRKSSAFSVQGQNNAQGGPVRGPNKTQGGLNQGPNQGQIWPVHKPMEPQRWQPKCTLCNGSHFNDECTVFATLEHRRWRLKELGRCLVCLQKTCTPHRCVNPKRRCVHCGKWGEHTRCVCPQQFGSGQIGGKPNTSREARSFVVAPKEGIPNNIKSNAHSDAQIQMANNMAHLPPIVADNAIGYQVDSDGELTNKVMTGVQSFSRYKIAFACIINPHTQVERVVRVFLDSGCNKTYITVELAKAMGLKGTNLGTTEVNVFGQEKSVVFESRQVNMLIKLIDGSLLKMSADTAPKLVGGITVQPLNLDDMRALQQFSNVQLSYFDLNRKHHTVTPDILIGLDYYHDIFTGDGQVTKLPSGLDVVPSKLGYIVCGTTKEPSVEKQSYTINFQRPDDRPMVNSLQARTPNNVDGSWPDI